MPTTPLQNQTLAQLQDALRQLKALCATTKDVDVYAAANGSQATLWGQISTLENLELAADSATMQAQAEAIAQSKAALDATLKTIATATTLLTNIDKFLGAVDLLIKAAKLVP